MERDEVEQILERLRVVCLRFPGAEEKLSHGSPTFFAKKVFATFHVDHHDDGRVAIWYPAPEGDQGLMVDSEPDRFYVPPYVGHRGWLGMRLDVDPDWDEVAAAVEEAYRLVAPRKLVAELDARG